MLGYGYNGGNSGSSKVKSIKLGRRMNDKKSFRLFRNVIYAVDELLPSMTSIRIRNILDNNGGILGDPFFDPNETSNSQRRPEDQVPNLYISQNRLYPYECVSEVVSVTPLWVDKAMAHGFVHDPSFYVPNLKQFLSGVVLLLLDLPEDAEDCITNEVRRFGGQHRDEFTDDITHLVCFDPRGAYYNQCIERNIPVVLPQWLDDCFRFRQKMDVDLYLLIDPVVYYEHDPTPATLHPYNDKEALSSTDNGDFNEIFEDHVIYLGQDIKMQEDLKNVLVDAIERAGGKIADQYDYQSVTIVILKHRSTRECRMASQDQKIIASLWWLTNTLLRGHHNSPLSTLLDYPIPPGGLPGMENVIISIAGYGGVRRQFLRRLVIALGAQYDPSITSTTTHLICGRTISQKYAQAQDLSNITIVNHIWLEECYQQWKMLDYNGDSRYTFIPRESTVLDASAGLTHLLIDELARWMESRTLPKFNASQYHIEEVDNNNRNNNENNQEEEQQGSINIRKRRRAAVKATRVLNTIVMPDVNAFEKESKYNR